MAFSGWCRRALMGSGAAVLKGFLETIESQRVAGRTNNRHTQISTH